MISGREFELLTSAESSSLEAPMGTSLGEDPAILSLQEQGLLSGSSITQAGLDALAPYRVKRVVFFAAGLGDRMLPVTINTPKPLVRVGNKRIIDTTLQALVSKGITDITIVRGYRKEQFDQLLYDYPTIRFIDNNIFDQANSMSSAYFARHILASSYVLEADLYLSNPDLIQKYQYHSNYLGVPVPYTDDWCFEVNDGRIERVKVGGEHCHHMFGISYWTEKDAAHLADSIEKCFQDEEARNSCWDVAVDRNISCYDLFIRECTFDDIMEIDTFQELQAVDHRYCI